MAAASLNCRRLVATDAAAYRRLMLHGYAHEADAFTSVESERASQPVDSWITRIDSATGIAFGAFDEDRMVATVAWEFSPRERLRHKAHLIGMYVHPDFRGRGLARRLMAMALEHARKRPGCTVATLTVTEGNAAAIALYESFGFKTFGVEPRAIRLNPLELSAAAPASVSGSTRDIYRAKVHMACLLDAAL